MVICNSDYVNHGMYGSYTVGSSYGFQRLVVLTTTLRSNPLCV